MKENKREKGIENHPLYNVTSLLIEKKMCSDKVQLFKLDSLNLSEKGKKIIVPVCLINRIKNDLRNIILQKLSPDFLCYIFVYIYNRQKLKNLKSEDYTDVEISSRYMRDKKSNYNAHIQFLIKANFIKLIKNYSTDVEKHHPRLYEINFDRLDNIELCIYKVNEVKIIALLDKKTSNIKSIDNDKLKLNFDKNEEFLSNITLSISDEELKDKIFKNYSNSKLSDNIKNYIMTEEFLYVKAFNDKNPIYFFSVYSDLTGRIYDSFKNLKSNLKQLFKVNNEKIADFDISNSHPLFLTLFLTEELIKIVEVEKIKYKNKTSVSNYQNITLEININENKTTELDKLLKNINLDYNITSTYLTIELDINNVKKELKHLTNKCFEGEFYIEFISDEICKKQDAKLIEVENEKQNCKKQYMFFENAELSNYNFIKFSKRFKKKYPDLFKLFIYKRIENYIQFSSHKNFGFELTKIESIIRLQVIKKYVFRASKNQIFDMHDGFLIEENPKNVEKINQAYKQSILKIFKSELDFLFNKQKKSLKIGLKQKS